MRYTRDDYPKAAREVGEELQIPIIDLNKMTRTFYVTLGVKGSKRAFVHYATNTFADQPEALHENTHFNTYGAHQIAKMVLQGIQDNRLPIGEHIVDFKRYDPSQPDRVDQWEWPRSIKNSDIKPDGN
ncbi:rhamnogalacturonan acetylesterase [Sphingobacterium sp. JB170]|nr:rhamnogalacturonan acetylesterase [Sphingobacterium sp. JB170]